MSFGINDQIQHKDVLDAAIGGSPFRGMLCNMLDTKRDTGVNEMVEAANLRPNTAQVQPMDVQWT